MPVHELLGGQVRDRIKVYSWIGGDRPARRRRAPRDAVVERGFNAVKMNGTEELQYHRHLRQGASACSTTSHAVREAVGAEHRHRRRLPRPRAQADGQGADRRSSSPYKLMFIEEPVLSEHLERCATSLRSAPTPIALGERLYSRWDFKHILASGVRRHHPAGPVALPAASPRPQDRRDGRGLRRRGGAALPARPDRAGDAACRSTPSATTPSSRNRASASTTTRATTCSTTSMTPPCSPTRTAWSRSRTDRAGHRGQRGLRHRRAAKGHRWRNPVWRHADGSFAEW